MEEYIAHLKQDENTDEWKIQSLEEHLNNTAEIAASFAGKFGDAQWGRLLGLWHDLGKYSLAFQDYIKKNSGYDESLTDTGKTDHSSAGAIWSVQQLVEAGYPEIQAKMAAYPIASHHSGLLNWVNEIGISGNLESRLSKINLLDEILDRIPENIHSDIPKEKPCNGRLNSLDQVHLWIRMLFSCLVDADRLDTERFMKPNKYSNRNGYISLIELKNMFDLYISDLKSNSDKTDLNRIRNTILDSCIHYGKMPNGFFSITVPTGGGKTLSSLAWALNHAIINNKDRIIVAIPFTSIITQTADIFRDIFGSDNVVEHHSDVNEEKETTQGKLAVENWDAPIIVTTNVQLFESLFSSKTSRTRKIHNIANSIIILDEVQALPVQFFKPLIKILQNLNDCFNTSILLSTATQPSLIGDIGSQEAKFKGFHSDCITEISGNRQQLSIKLKRVNLFLPKDKHPIDWNELANKLKPHRQVLCIVNTRKDCQTLFSLMPEGTIHLSRLMCSEHISKSLKLIKTKLDNNEPVQVISTQLIEAGVDIDFPVVYRAFIGLDSIAQTAGRCNREGKLAQPGKVIVFHPPKQAPPGYMRKGCDAMNEIMSLKPMDYLVPECFSQYFKCFYSKVQNFDREGIEDYLVRDAQSMNFQFASASKKFRLIDDDGSVSIFIWYGKGISLIEALKKYGPEKKLLKQLQRYSVSLRQRDFESAKTMNLIEEINGFWIQASDLLYDNITGIQINNEWCNETFIM